MDDRTRIVVGDLGIALSVLFAIRRLFRSIPETDEPFDSSSLIVGAISGVAIQYASERDPIAGKLHRYRYRFAHSLVVQAYQRLLYRSFPSRESVAVGYLLGIVLNRFVFGLVFDVPNGRLEQPSLFESLR